MITKLSRLSFLAFAVVAAGNAFGGPEATEVQVTTVRQPAAVKWHKKIIDTVLVACGVVEPPPVYVAPGYLETAGPAPILIYHPSGALRPRRVSHPEGEEKPAAAPAANPAPSPVVGDAPAAAPAPLPVPAPASSPAAPMLDATPTDAEPSLLPEADPRSSSARSHTDEMLSYFQRQHAVARPYSASPLPPGEGAPNDSPAEPSFLQAPQTPEQPVLPPSRATYHVVP